mgnify:CR=1 FL=1
MTTYDQLAITAAELDLTLDQYLQLQQPPVVVFVILEYPPPTTAVPPQAQVPQCEYQEGMLVYPPVTPHFHEGTQ